MFNLKKWWCRTKILLRVLIWMVTHRILLEINGGPFGLLFHHASCGKRHLVFLGYYVLLIRCVWVFLFPIRVSVAVCLDNLKDIKNNWNSVWRFLKMIDNSNIFFKFLESQQKQQAVYRLRHLYQDVHVCWLSRSLQLALHHD